MAGVENRSIVLLTDFGQQDIFAGVLKGVIASINPESKVIDLSHGVNPQDIHQASFLLAVSCLYFPKGTVFCVIVDPGVGSARKGICIETRDYSFVGPDNGVLWQAAKENKIKKIIHLTNKAYFPGPVSNTFHGRDIFAPVAAHISKGLEDISCLGESLEKCVEYQFPGIERKALSLVLTVIHIDRFGNITLNLEEKEYRQFIKNRWFVLTINDIQIKKVFSSYSQAKDGELFLIESSSSYMEIALKNSNA
ncbi:MAG: SAM-dependent chlorinase/fluorinase, partial [Desulfobacterales bacterium]|nr:SAM-dependent chlorinase/fluorinase [Desulfobacterales bacterium]